MKTLIKLLILAILLSSLSHSRDCKSLELGIKQAKETITHSKEELRNKQLGSSEFKFLSEKIRQAKVALTLLTENYKQSQCKITQ